MKIDKAQILEAMKAHAIPAAWSNLWYVTKAEILKPTPGIRHSQSVLLEPGKYTWLYRVTDSTMYSDPPGEVVMEDTPFELRTHLGFVLRAHGNVLVTGLGLGCVVRGLLANPAVESVTCIENSPDVLNLVAKYMPTSRLAIIEADALEWTAKNIQIFDCAWHDLWTDRDAGEPHLDFWHTQLLRNLRKTVKNQGAWALDRGIKKKLISNGFPWVG